MNDLKGPPWTSCCSRSCCQVPAVNQQLQHTNATRNRHCASRVQAHVASTATPVAPGSSSAHHRSQPASKPKHTSKQADSKAFTTHTRIRTYLGAPSAPGGSRRSTLGSRGGMMGLVSLSRSITAASCGRISIAATTEAAQCSLIEMSSSSKSVSKQ